MRNLKKVLALVVAVAMLASMGLVASAASYTDVASTASYADAVNLLSNLGIIKGYEDGTFKPDNTVTRAEAATMMVRMLALDEDAEQGATNFTDVAADNWASGYINVAEANGIINGMGDGTFNPNGEVTYGQIVKMIVCALGYEPVALANGGYLGGGYLYAASKEAGFTKGVAGTANGAASRATVAKLIYNALEVELMDQETFSTGINGSEYKVQEGKTILSEYLELEKVEGVVTETYLSDAYFDVEDDKYAKVLVTKNYDNTPAFEAKASAQKFLLEGVDVSALLGYSVVAYVGLNEDEEATMYAVAEKAGKNEVLVLDRELVQKAAPVTDKNNVTRDMITYWKSKSSNKTIDAEFQAYVEGKFVTVTNGVASVQTQSKAIANVVENGFNVNNKNGVDQIKTYDKYLTDPAVDEVTLLDNDNDGDFEFLFVTYADLNAKNFEEFVVSEITNEDELWIFDGEGKSGSYEIDYEDAVKTFTVIKDGKLADASAIAEGDVITVLNTDVNMQTVYVSSTVVEGTVDEVETDKNNVTTYTINGSDYKKSGLSTVGAIEPGDEGLFYINASGKIAKIDDIKSISAANYVYVVDAHAANTSTNWDDKTMLKVVNAEGAVETLVLKETKVRVVEPKAPNGVELTAVNAVTNYFGTAKNGMLVKVDTNASGEVTDIYLPGVKNFTFDDRYDTDAKANLKEYNEARGTYGMIDLAPETLVFDIDPDTKEKLVDRVTVTTVGSLFVDESSYTFTAYYAETDEPASALVVTASNASADSEAPVMVVTKTSRVTSEDDKAWKVTGILAGETVSVILDPTNYNANLAAPVAEGDVIIYVESDGFADKVKVLYDYKGTGLAGTTTEIIAGKVDEKLVTIHYAAKVVEKENAYFTVGANDDDKFWFADDVNVTVVDETGREVTIEKGTLSAVKPSAKTTKSVFFKTIAGEKDVVSDIVVFIK